MIINHLNLCIENLVDDDNNNNFIYHLLLEYKK